jgi:hypothetical protein
MQENGGATLRGPCEIVSAIGSGGIAEVFRAQELRAKAAARK